MGGLFATYTLFRQPDAFARYVIGSPWLCWNSCVSERYEQDYAATHTDLKATVFLAAGADEAVLRPGFPAPMASMYREADTAARTRRLGEALTSRNYPSLRLTTRIFPEETHFTIPAILLAHGLRNVFAPS
jgi:predicted alpha/beta superfamily hydrolase